MEKYRVDTLTRKCLAECQKKGISISRGMVSYLVEWLLSSHEDTLSKADEEKTSLIYQSIIGEIFANGPTVRVLKLKYHFETNMAAASSLESLRIKHENMLKAKLAPLTESISVYRAMADDDHKELLGKILLYIIASNQLFNTKDTHMMAEAKTALHTIFTDHDMKEFVERKKHFRIDYLHTMGRILCGILLFNKYTGLGGEGIRDVVNDTQLAYRTIMESVRMDSVRYDRLILKGLEVVARMVSIKPVEGKIVYKLPKDVELDEVKLFNKYNYLHLLTEIYTNRMVEPLKRVKYTIQGYIQDINNALHHLEDVLKFRLAVPTEMVYPYFMQLYEAWNNILMELQYLAHLKKFHIEMSEIVESNYPFEEIAMKLSAPLVVIQEYSMPFDIASAGEGISVRTRNRRASLFINPLQQFCALTMGLTGGLLVKSELTFGVLPFFQQVITFKRRDYCTFAQKYYYKFTTYFMMTAIRNPEMCILFKIPIEFSPFKKRSETSMTNVELFAVEATKEAGNQTENCLPPSTIEERNKFSWNVWDYRRRAIQLANIRKSQTHSSQTDITYCKRDAILQTYDKVTSTHRCICSSSQLNRSVCQILDETEKAYPSDCPPEECPPEKK